MARADRSRVLPGHPAPDLAVSGDTPTAPRCAHCPHPQADHTAAGALGRKPLCNSCQPADWSHEYKPADGNDDGLRERYAAAMREHYLSSNAEEADADGNMPCRCGDWREGGDADEYDWDHHLTEAVLAVRDHRMERLVAERDMLGRDADRLRRDWVAMRERAETAEAKLAAVRALHQVAAGVGWNPDDDLTPGAYGDIKQACTTCGTVGEYAVRWPCPTIAALDGLADTTPGAGR